MGSAERIPSPRTGGSTFGRLPAAGKTPQSMVPSDPYGDLWMSTLTTRVRGKSVSPDLAGEQSVSIPHSHTRGAPRLPLWITS